ncbi:caspase family protein [Glycomyces sp. TRM65418]|uniref:caspase, EACC1-associated type n=1 Tax=Glycomyces sp. TRM65418 TaxID=2867006 RepID=UPI001D16FB00|nr:caspase family protein [Glycomyces sp. TRM65418]MCC3764454.1 caspase family protein [Glycomyces sp. TRM65418]
MPPGSRAVLVGVSAYEYPELPPVRAARNSLDAMLEILTSPVVGRWSREDVTVIRNPDSVSELSVELTELAEAAAGVFLLYYVGHGLLSERGDLCLTLTSTRPNRPKITGLPWQTITDIFGASPAQTRIAVLDCCFAGQAIEALTSEGTSGLADITHVQGVYTLTATTANRTAHVPPPDQQDNACTSFTGELRDLVRAGISHAPIDLTFEAIYPALRARLQAKGLPLPNQRGTDTASRFPLALNQAALAASGHLHRTETGTHDPGRAAEVESTDPRVSSSEILDLAIKLAEEAGTLNEIACSVVEADPTRTEAIARMIPDESERGSKPVALAAMADSLAKIDPVRSERLGASAEQLVMSCEVVSKKISGLSWVAWALSSEQPMRSTRMINELVRIADPRLIDSDDCIKALTAASALMYARDPSRSHAFARKAADLAERDRENRYPVLKAIASAMALADPNGAKRWAAGVGLPQELAEPTSTQVQVIAMTDPLRAEAVAQHCTQDANAALALALVADMVSRTDEGRAREVLARAELFAQRIEDPAQFVHTMSFIARIHAEIGSYEAERLLEQCQRIVNEILIASVHQQAKAEVELVNASIAKRLAHIDPDAAMETARSIESNRARAVALAGIAGELAKSDRRTSGAGAAAVEIANADDPSVMFQRSVTPAHAADHFPAEDAGLAPSASVPIWVAAVPQPIRNEHLLAGALGTSPDARNWISNRLRAADEALQKQIDDAALGSRIHGPGLAGTFQRTNVTRRAGFVRMQRDHEGWLRVVANERAVPEVNLLEIGESGSSAMFANYLTPRRYRDDDPRVFQWRRALGIVYATVLLSRELVTSVGLKADIDVAVRINGMEGFLPEVPLDGLQGIQADWRAAERNPIIDNCYEVQTTWTFAELEAGSLEPMYRLFGSLLRSMNLDDFRKSGT